MSALTPIEHAISVVAEAEKLMGGDRNEEYGCPSHNFSTIADLWTAYTGHKFTAEDVGIMLGLMKVSRMRQGTAKRDTFVDAAAYMALAFGVSEKK